MQRTRGTLVSQFALYITVNEQPDDRELQELVEDVLTALGEPEITDYRCPEYDPAFENEAELTLELRQPVEVCWNDPGDYGFGAEIDSEPPEADEVKEKLKKAGLDVYVHPLGLEFESAA